MWCSARSSYLVEFSEQFGGRRPGGPAYGRAGGHCAHPALGDGDPAAEAPTQPAAGRREKPAGRRLCHARTRIFPALIIRVIPGDADRQSFTSLVCGISAVHTTPCESRQGFSTKPQRRSWAVGVQTAGRLVLLPRNLFQRWRRSSLSGRRTIGTVMRFGPRKRSFGAELPAARVREGPAQSVSECACRTDQITAHRTGVFTADGLALMKALSKHSLSARQPCSREPAQPRCLPRLVFAVG